LICDNFFCPSFSSYSFSCIYASVAEKKAFRKIQNEWETNFSRWRVRNKISGPSPSPGLYVGGLEGYDEGDHTPEEKIGGDGGGGDMDAIYKQKSETGAKHMSIKMVSKMLVAMAPSRGGGGGIVDISSVSNSSGRITSEEIISYFSDKPRGASPVSSCPHQVASALLLALLHDYYNYIRACR